MHFRLLCSAVTILGLVGCQAGESAPESGPTQAYSGISPSETVKFTGTEPFWGGEVKGDQMVYTTPDDPAGQRFMVDSFAGNNGVSYSGLMNDQPFDMMITPGECSDGMSDRTYPFTVTLMLGSQQLRGCAWTDRQLFSGPEQP